MPQLSINQDYRFNYVLIGDRRQPVILLLHGFMGNCNDFSAVIEQLDDFCCLVVDLPGHGQTEVKHDANYLMPDTAQAIITLLKYLAIKQCWLWGYSMGGRIALYLTIYFSQYFWGVILESTSPGLKTRSEREQRIQQDLKLAKRLESVELSQFIHQWYQNPLFSSFIQHPGYQQAFTNRLNNNPFKLAKSLRMIGLGMQPSLWHCLSDIGIPMMFMVGALDCKFLMINRQMLDVCPQAKLGIIPNTGHNIHFENPLAIVKMFKKIIQ
ncbi:MAG: 2-succinyl-6-hydroxy-2,4-cyclohexadiene-1-carboxylate synthase [Cyanobacteria bacterium P01_G01_bin.39]